MTMPMAILVLSALNSFPFQEVYAPIRTGVKRDQAPPRKTPLRRKWGFTHPDAEIPPLGDRRSRPAAYLA